MDPDFERRDGILRAFAGGFAKTLELLKKYGGAE